jgi:hypothetical protein
MSDVFKSFLLAVLACAAPVAHADEPVAGTSWRIDEKTDEITDAVSYFVANMAKESESKSLFADTTALVIKIEPEGRTKSNDMKFKRYVSIYNHGGPFDVDETRITTRFNREKATTSTWVTMQPLYKLAIAVDSAALFSKIETSTNLLVRFKTIIGETKTLTFDVHGLTNALQKVKAKYLATNPPLVKPKKPAAAPKPDTKPRRKKK